jgi:hypothetical protein
MNDTDITPYVSFEIKDGIIHAAYKRGVKLNLDIARNIVAYRLEFTKGLIYPAIIFNQGVISIDKPARDFLSSAEGVKNLAAAALILDSAFGSFLGNFILSVTRPPLIAKIFTKPELALKWLQQYKVN